MPDQPAESFTPDADLPMDVPGFIRRGSEPRRQADRTLKEKCMALAGDMGKMVVLCSAVIAVLSWFGTILGFRFYGPTQQMAAIVTRQDSADAANIRLGLRVGRLEDGARETRTTLRLQSYLLCTQRTPNDPTARAKCLEIIEEMQHPGGAP